MTILVLLVVIGGVIGVATLAATRRTPPSVDALGMADPEAPATRPEPVADTPGRRATTLAALDVAASLGFTDVQADEEGFVLDVTVPGGGGTLDLGSVVDAVATGTVPLEQALTDALAPLRHPTTTWSELAPTLVPRVGNGASLVARALRDGWHPDDGPPPVLLVDALLGVDVVARDDHTLRTVTAGLQALGVSLHDAVDTAFDGLGARLRPASPSTPPGVIGTYATRYRSERLLLVDFDRWNQALVLVAAPDLPGLAGGPLVALPLTRHDVFLAPLDDRSALEDLINVAARSLRHPHRISLLPYVSLPGGGADGVLPWVPWEPAADDPLHAPWQRLRCAQDAADHELLRPALQAAELARHRDTYVAPLRVVDDPDVPGGLTTTTLWPPFPALVAAARTMDVLPQGERTVWRVPTEAIRSVLEAHTTTVPHLLGLVLRTSGAFPADQLERVRRHGTPVAEVPEDWRPPEGGAPW